MREREKQMFTALNLQVSSPAIKPNCRRSFTESFASRRSLVLRLPKRSLASHSFESSNASSEPSTSSHSTSTIGCSPPSSLQSSHWNLTQRHIVVLNVIACATAISATWFFCSAIPTLLAFKRAAESLEKLLDVTREELPDTMASVRLSAMELSDLTMELSDLGHGITQGVKRSTRAIHLAQEKLSQMANRVKSGGTHYGNQDISTHDS